MKKLMFIVIIVLCVKNTICNTSANESNKNIVESSWQQQQNYKWRENSCGDSGDEPCPSCIDYVIEHLNPDFIDNVIRCEEILQREYEENKKNGIDIGKSKLGYVQEKVGQLLLASGNLNKAIDYYEKSYKFRPYISILSILGQLYDLKGDELVEKDPEDAQKYYDKARNTKPTNVYHVLPSYKKLHSSKQK